MKLNKEQAEKLFVKLSWEILEHKFRYYEGAKHGLTPIADEAYDKIESNYKKLASALKINPTASDMVGFDINKPSCKLVMKKLTGK